MFFFSAGGLSPTKEKRAKRAKIYRFEAGSDYSCHLKGLKYELRDIKADNPALEELTEWHQKSGLPLKRFFNTSGLLYKSLDLKNRLPDMSQDEQLKLLSTDGMLVKRPILICAGVYRHYNDGHLVGHLTDKTPKKEKLEKEGISNAHAVQDSPYAVWAKRTPSFYGDSTKYGLFSYKVAKVLYLIAVGVIY